MRNVLNKPMICLIIFMVVLNFVIISTVAYSSFPQSRGLKQLTEQITSDDLLYFMGFENAHFNQALPNSYERPSLVELSFELATNIVPGDARSLLGREIPGFAHFDTRIIVPGEGTDFTNMPVESPAPMSVLLEEREASKELLEEEEAEPSLDGEVELVSDAKVFIHHSHSWESFLPHLPGANGDPNLASHNEVNITKVGERLGNSLQKQGIQSQVDLTNMTSLLNERDIRPSRAYEVSREIVQEAITDDEDITYIFDLHRDSARKDVSTVDINNESYARLLFVIGEAHPNYEKNLELATRLNDMLEEEYPGISRGVFGKNENQGNGVYNQDLSENSILIEFGGVDNDFDELNRSADAFADIFTRYIQEVEGESRSLIALPLKVCSQRAGL